MRFRKRRARKSNNSSKRSKTVKQGDFTVRLPYHKDGVLNAVGELLNDIIILNEHMASEFIRVSKIVGSRKAA